jgi:hypothetical protein
MYINTCIDVSCVEGWVKNSAVKPYDITSRLEHFKTKLHVLFTNAHYNASDVVVNVAIVHRFGPSCDSPEGHS